MKIYVAHSTSFDFKNDLYAPIKSIQSSKFEFVLPHDLSDDQFSSQKLFESGECALILAEVSYPSTGLGIEIGWASYKEIPIICIYKSGSKVSGSIKMVTDRIIEYSNSSDLIKKIEEIISNIN